MADLESLIRLREELRQDAARLVDIERKNTRAAERIAAGARDELDYAALAYTIHNLYGLIENYALRIAKTFENHIEGSSWHRDLLERLALDLSPIRPALWDRPTVKLLDELRRFRHVFRNMYADDLDPQRVLLVQERVPQTVSLVRIAHRRFAAALEIAIEAAE